jgi:hypothetical protein
MKLILVALLVTLATLTTTSLVFASTRKRTYTDPHLGTTNFRSMVNYTAEVALSENVKVNSPLSFELYLTALDKIEREYNAAFLVDPTSSALNSHLRFDQHRMAIEKMAIKMMEWQRVEAFISSYETDRDNSQLRHERNSKCLR